MKRIFKKILNALGDAVMAVFGLSVLTVLYTVTAAIFIAMFVVGVPYLTIHGMIEYDLPLCEAFIEGVHKYFEALKETFNVVFDKVEL